MNWEVQHKGQGGTLVIDWGTLGAMFRERRRKPRPNNYEMKPTSADAIQTKGASMDIVIGNYQFDGPFTQPGKVRDEPAIYALLCYAGNDFDILEFGKTQSPKSLFETIAQFDLPQGATTSIAVFYTAGHSDAAVEEMLKDLHSEYFERTSSLTTSPA